MPRSSRTRRIFHFCRVGARRCSSVQGPCTWRIPPTSSFPSANSTTRLTRTPPSHGTSCLNREDGPRRVRSPRAEYDRRIERWTAAIDRGERRHLLYSNVRLAVAAIIVAVLWL